MEVERQPYQALVQMALLIYMTHMICVIYTPYIQSSEPDSMRVPPGVACV